MSGIEESLAEVFAAEFVLPVQIDGTGGAAVGWGERALRLAVLEDAIRCFQRHRRSPRAQPDLLARQAEAWIMEDGEWPFSFVAVCEALDICPRALRAALVAWKARHRPAGGPARFYRLHLRTRRRRLCAAG